MAASRPSSNSAPSLLAKIDDKSAVIGIVGLGYVGLPLIQAFIGAGYRTLGFDVDRTKVDSLLAGRSYIGHIPSEWIASCVASGKFTPTADMGRMGEADAILICVPTPLSESRDPDLSFIEATARQIAASLRPRRLKNCLSSSSRARVNRLIASRGCLAAR